MGQTIALKESSEARVSLSFGQASAIAALGRRLASKTPWWGDVGDDARSERTVIDCKPLSDGTWSIAAWNAIGAFGVDDITFVVQPKISAGHVLYLIAQGAALPRIEQQLIALAAANELWEVIALWFILCTQRVVLQDLVKDYQSVSRTIPAVRGQIDAIASAGLYYAGSLHIACEYDRFTIDNAFNRVLFAALTALQRLTKLSYSTRRTCRRLSAHFDGVGQLSGGDLLVQTDRRTAYYDDALSLARIILSALAIALATGSGKAWSFLIRTPEVIEAGIFAILRAGLGPSVRVSKYSTMLQPSELRVCPDLRFDPPGNVGDVKYKTFGIAWPRADLYQSVAFAAACGTKRACVVSFDDAGSSVVLPPVRFGEIEVSNIVWQARDDLEPSVAASCLIYDCENWLALQRA